MKEVTFVIRDASNEVTEIEEEILPTFLQDLNSSRSFIYVSVHRPGRLQPKLMINKDDIIKVEIS